MSSFWRSSKARTVFVNTQFQTWLGGTIILAEIFMPYLRPSRSMLDSALKLVIVTSFQKFASQHS